MMNLNELIYIGETLPEIVVKPSKDLDYIRKNIPDKETRKNIMEYITNDGIKKIDYLVGVTNSLAKEHDYEILKDFTFREENDFLKELRELNVNDQIKRLSDVYKWANYPKINKNASLLGKLLKSIRLDYGTGTSRAYMNPITNKLYNIKNYSDLISELSHSYNENRKNNIKDLGYVGILGLLSAAFDTPEHTVYDRPYNLEFTTHYVTEPTLDRYVKTGNVEDSHWKTHNNLSESEANKIISEAINSIVENYKYLYDFPILENIKAAGSDLIYNLKNRVNYLNFFKK